jgi:hypothetical protein
MTAVKVVKGALDVIEVDGVELLALRGQIDPHSLKNILTPPYQREVLSLSKIERLKDALRTSRVPEIDLGMRGDQCREMGKGIFMLHDPVYVVDGLQRKTAGEQLVEAGLALPHIGALIHFNTTEEWELKRFTDLNTGQTGLSNNVMLRNLALRNAGAAVMYRLATQDKIPVLGGKICWTQNMRVGDLLTAITYYKVVGRLMGHAGPGRSGPIISATGGIDKMIAAVSRNVFIHNVRTFFQLIDETFGIANVAYRNQAVQLKASFLLALAGVISDHENFWDGDRLDISPDLKKRLAAFPINDQHVRQLAGSAGQAITILEVLIIEHLNYKKTTRKLKRRKTASELPEALNGGDE